MSSTDMQLEAVRTAIEPAVRALGLDLYDVDVVGGAAARTLRVTLARDGRARRRRRGRVRRRNRSRRAHADPVERVDAGAHRLRLGPAATPGQGAQGGEAAYAGRASGREGDTMKNPEMLEALSALAV